MSWTVTPAGTYLVEIRDDIGLGIEWEGTVDGAWTSAAAELAFRNDEAGALLLSTILLDTAPDEVVAARALDAGITPRVATPSIYIVEAAGSGVLSFGAEIRGGGELGQAIWTVTDATASVTPGDKVTIQSVESGPVTLSSPITLTLIAPVVGLSELTYDSGDGDAFQVGRDAETRAELVVRIKSQRGGTGSEPALRSDLLEIDWVIATNIDAGGGFLATTVAPAPVGSAQESELANTIYKHALGVITLGSLSTSITDVNGDALTISYSAGATQAVAVVAVLTLDGTVSSADAINSASAALSGEFATLSNGDSILYHKAYSSLDLPGVLGYTLTLDGGTVSIAPTNAADILVGAITVTAP